MKKEIKTRKDIVQIIDQFYKKVEIDSLLGHFFTDVAEVNWEDHKTVMTNFWENILFHTSKYEGNPMTAHKRVHSMEQLSPAHFEHWTKLFIATIDAHFLGENAELLKTKAKSIAIIMQQNLFQK